MLNKFLMITNVHHNTMSHILITALKHEQIVAVCFLLSSIDGQPAHCLQSAGQLITEFSNLHSVAFFRQKSSKVSVLLDVTDVLKELSPTFCRFHRR